MRDHGAMLAMLRAFPRFVKGGGSGALPPMCYLTAPEDDGWRLVPLAILEQADEIQRQADAARSGLPCPDAEVCKACRCALEDDVCLPIERLEEERDTARWEA